MQFCFSLFVYYLAYAPGFGLGPAQNQIWRPGLCAISIGISYPRRAQKAQKWVLYHPGWAQKSPKWVSDLKDGPKWLQYGP